MADLWGQLGGEIIKGIWRGSEHKLNEAIHGKERAAQIKRQKYDRQRVKDANQASVFGILCGLAVFLLFAVNSNFDPAATIGGAVAGVIAGWGFSAFMFWLSDSSNPYR